MFFECECSKNNNIDKYRFQKKYQKKVGLRTKTYRMKTDTIEKITKFSESHNESHASILRNAYEYYTKHTEEFAVKFWLIKEDYKFDTWKGFKIKQDFVNQIAETCNSFRFTKGAFVSLIIDDYINQRIKCENKKRIKEGELK